MREPAPFYDDRDAYIGRPQDPYEAASCCTEIGIKDRDDLSLPVLEIIKTLLFAIVIVATTALIASLAQG